MNFAPHRGGKCRRSDSRYRVPAKGDGDRRFIHVGHLIYSPV